MATITFDPEAITARRDKLLAEVKQLDDLLAMVPVLRRLAPRDESATRPMVRSVSSERLDQARRFVHELPVDTFTMADAITWINKNVGAFDPDKERNELTAAFRHLVAEGVLVIEVKGFGRKAQVWRKSRSQSVKSSAA